MNETNRNAAFLIYGGIEYRVLAGYERFEHLNVQQAHFPLPIFAASTRAMLIQISANCWAMKYARIWKIGNSTKRDSMAEKMVNNEICAKGKSSF